MFNIIKKGFLTSSVGRVAEKTGKIANQLYLPSSLQHAKEHDRKSILLGHIKG